MTTTTSQHREFGLWRSTSLVVGNIVGSGIFLLPASLGIYGAVGLFGWMVTSVGSICLALIFARLSAHFPKIGGPYAYSKEAFGDFVGFQMAWSYWVGTWASNAAIATAFVSYMSVFWPSLATNATHAFALAFCSVWFFTGLNIWSVKSTGIAQVVIVVLKIVPLIVIGLFGSFYVNFAHFSPVNPSGLPWFTALSSAAALTLYAFLGLESATVPAESVVDPKITIPRATVIGTVLSAVIYVWTTIVLLGVLPPQQLAKSAAPFAEAAGLLFGPWASSGVAICAAIAAFGTLNGWILIQGQMPLAAAQDGLFPKAFAKLSKRGTPVFGLLASSILMTGMLILNYQASLVEQFTAIVTFTTFSMLIPYLYSAMADLVFLVTKADYVSKAHLARSVIVATIGLAYTVLIVIGCGQKAVFLGMLCMFAGFPIYIFMRYSPSSCSSSRLNESAKLRSATHIDSLE